MECHTGLSALAVVRRWLLAKKHRTSGKGAGQKEEKGGKGQKNEQAENAAPAKVRKPRQVG